MPRIPHRLLPALFAALFAVSACAKTAVQNPPLSTPEVDAALGEPDMAEATVPEDIKAVEPVLPMPTLVTFGDVHGDGDAFEGALVLAGAITVKGGPWTGGDLIVVQVGDQLDRGPDERQILDRIEVLSAQATKAGGALTALLGNHEVMNVAWDFRYVTEAGWAAFADFPFTGTPPVDLTPEQLGRAAAFRPGGPYAKILSGHSVWTQVQGTVFVHGGLLPMHAKTDLDALNADTSAWMRGDAPYPAALKGDESPIWSRHYSDEPDSVDCALLIQTLKLMGAKRMVVGHTVHKEGITSACEGRVWRVDVGMASYYGGSPAVLKLTIEPTLGAEILTP